MPRRNSLVAALAVLAVACLLGVGCGGEDSQDEQAARLGQDTATTAQKPPPPTSAPKEKDQSKPKQAEKRKPKKKIKSRPKAPEEPAPNPEPEPAPPAATTPRPAPRPPKRVEVTIRDFQFTPKRVTIRLGGSVYWVNKSKGNEHTATFKTGPKARTGDYAPPASPYIGRMGGTYEDFFKTPGTTVYYCTIHPKMRGFITVK